MKLFVWVQGKLNGGHGCKKPTSNLVSPHDYHHSLQEARKEEFSDWPHGLLAIGTFGNKDIDKDQVTDQRKNHQDHHQVTASLSQPEHASMDDVWKLQQEFNSPLPNYSSESTGNNIFSQSNLHQSASCPSSSEINNDMRGVLDELSQELSSKDDNIPESDNSLVPRNKLGKDHVLLDSAKKNGLGKRSLSLLLKKMFVCSSGFTHVPSTIKDPILEPRMEKILRAILRKKIYLQNSSQALSRRYLDHRQVPKSSNNEEQIKVEAANIGSKWDRTDSEYIVLEI